MGKIMLESLITQDSYCDYVFNNYDIQNKERTITEVPIPSKEDMAQMDKDDWNPLPDRCDTSKLYYIIN